VTAPGYPAPGYPALGDSVSSYPALRFVHPYFDAEAGEPGLRVAPAGRLAVVDGHASVRQAILLLLSTAPGERVMRPEYGCDLDKLMFAPNDDTTAGLAIHYVRRALERWEPRIDIVRLDAGQSAEYPERLEIALEYRVRATQLAERLAFQVSLAGHTR
jgi:uncharacterized protein